MFSFLQCLSGGHVSNVIGEIHLHEIVAFGGHQGLDTICRPMLDSSVCWAEGILMEGNMMSAIKVVVRVFRLGLGHKG